MPFVCVYLYTQMSPPHPSQGPNVYLGYERGQLRQQQQLSVSVSLVITCQKKGQTGASSTERRESMAEWWGVCACRWRDDESIVCLFLPPPSCCCCCNIWWQAMQRFTSFYYYYYFRRSSCWQLKMAAAVVAWHVVITFISPSKTRVIKRKICTEQRICTLLPNIFLCKKEDKTRKCGSNIIDVGGGLWWWKTRWWWWR